MQISEAMTWGEKELFKKNIENSRMETLWILSSSLSSSPLNPLNLYAERKKTLKKSEWFDYRKKISLRRNHLPLAYILGVQEFFGLKFFVNPQVLIPRSETEILVQNALNQYLSEKQITILDVGTGSGNISIALAKHLPNSKIFATDLSKKTLKIAEKNAVLNGVRDKIFFLNGHLFEPIKKMNLEFDLIISNPPYVAEDDYNQLQEEVKKEPPRALLGGKKGLDLIARLIQKSPHYLKKNGFLMLEIGYNQSEEVKMMMKNSGFLLVKTMRDNSGIPRVVAGIWKGESKCALFF